MKVASNLLNKLLQGSYTRIQFVAGGVLMSVPAFAAEGGLVEKANMLFGLFMAIIAGACGVALGVLCLQAMTGRKGWLDVLSAVGFAFVGMAASGIVAYLKLAGSGTFTA